MPVFASEHYIQSVARLLGMSFCRYLVTNQIRGQVEFLTWSVHKMKSQRPTTVIMSYTAENMNDYIKLQVNKSSNC